MPPPIRPTDLYVTNGWYLELPGIVSPHFETLEGVSQNSNTVAIVDSGTNRRYKFGTQIIDYGDMTLTRTLQGTPDDVVLDATVVAMIQLGLKVNAVAIKLHHLVEAFRLIFEGFRVVSVAYPSFDVNGEEKFLMQYSCTCDGFVKI